MEADMKTKHLHRIVALVLPLAVLSSYCPSATAQSATNAKTSPGKAAVDEVLLRYKLAKGQVVSSEVTHLAKTDTRIEKTEQSSQSRTISKKLWEVSKVEPNGDATFVFKVVQVDMSQQIGDAEEIRFNSETDIDPPEIYKSVADSLHKPIATITINSRGVVVKRDEKGSTSTLGMGDVTITFPEKPIKPETEWDVPREVRVRLEDGGSKVIKIREVYRLEKVSAGVATISVRSEPLTPYDDPSIEAQVVQQMSNGTIKFDVDAGQMISKELQWNESIVGFSGPGSMMTYSARYTEEVQASKATAAAPSRKVGTVKQRR
jgi:hypothetical protein